MGAKVGTKILRRDCISKWGRQEWERGKRDGNTPTGSGQAPFTEGRTQRAQRKEKGRKEGKKEEKKEGKKKEKAYTEVTESAEFAEKKKPGRERRGSETPESKSPPFPPEARREGHPAPRF